MAPMLWLILLISSFGLFDLKQNKKEITISDP